MRYLVIAAILLAFPTLAVGQSPSATAPVHTILPGMGEDPRVTFRCQFQMVAGYIAPSEIVAKDVTTGAVLFELPAGTWLTENRCVNAPDGHSLDLLAPGAGTKYEIAPEAAKP